MKLQVWDSAWGRKDEADGSFPPCLCFIPTFLFFSPQKFYFLAFQLHNWSEWMSSNGGKVFAIMILFTDTLTTAVRLALKNEFPVSFVADWHPG